MSTLESLASQVSALAKKVDANQEYCDTKFLDAERKDVIG